MSSDKSDPTAFFETAAKRLGVAPQRLAGLVNDIDTKPLRDWDELFERDDIEKDEIEVLRSQLFESLAKAKYHRHRGRPLLQCGEGGFAN